MKRAIPYCSVLFALTTAGIVHADVKMPAIFGDHMVLQQDAKLPVWGTADAGEKVTVTVGGETGTATADASGKWRVDLKPLAATDKPVAVTVAGKNTIKFDDVLVGDVWVCSGQSNMEFGLANDHFAGDTIPKANDPQLRLFHVPHHAMLDPQTDVVAQWEVCTPETVKTFTAVGYYFGRDLRATLNRPIGLIETSWGGTPAQSWTPIGGLKKDPELAEYVAIHDKMVADFPAAIAAYPGLQAQWTTDEAEWQKDVGVTYNPQLEEWKKAAAAAKAAGQPIPPQPQPSKPRPKAPADPNGGGGTPTALYNGMVAPLIPYAIKGAIWYQGESNAGKAEQYKVLFARMITEWREHWGEGDFPFFFVQLAAFGTRNGPDDSYAFLRESQTKTLALPNTGMATAIDIGSPGNIHPQDKRDVGQRLAAAAKHVAYGQTLVYGGPTYASMKVEGNAVRISYANIGGGLIIGAPEWRMPDAPVAPSDKLSGFEIAGDDKNWVEADAKIDGNTVVVSSVQVAKPVAVRYAWHATPTVNLYNKEMFPAFPFRTDDWPRVTTAASAAAAKAADKAVPPTPTTPPAPAK